MIVPPTRATAAADELRRRILEGDYPGGQVLRQAALADELGISRIPLREALIQLEAEGLIQLTAHKSAIVVEVSAADVAELFEFRAILEPKLLEKSAPHLSERDFGELNSILREYRDELRHSHVGRWGELNRELHSLLYRHANCPRMAATVDQLLKSTDRFTRMQLYYTDGRERAEEEHLEIVRKCELGQYDVAVEVLRQHIENAGATLVSLLSERKQATVREAI